MFYSVELQMAGVILLTAMAVGGISLWLKRRKLEKEGRVSKGDGKDVDHKKPLRHGGTNNDCNLRVRDKSSNRAENGKKKTVKEEHGAGEEGTMELLNKYLQQTPGQFPRKKKKVNHVKRSNT